jgi:hypothetical protein
LLTVEDYRTIRNRQISDIRYTFIFWLIIGIASIIFIWLIAILLTRPIKNLQQLMGPD